MGEVIRSVRGADRSALGQALSHWDRVAKPLNSSGVLEGDITRIAGASGSHHISIDREATVVTYADNGTVEEGVTQIGQEITAAVAGDIGKGCFCVCLMIEEAGAKVIPIDVDTNCCGEVPGVIPEKVSMDTKNSPRESAMSHEQTAMAMGAGIRVAGDLKSGGYNLMDSGEMEIENTIISSAVLSILPDQDPGQVTGQGASLVAKGYKRKMGVTRDGIVLCRPGREDSVDVLSRVGGLDLTALTGFYIGCGAVGLPTVTDGLITGATASAAVGICPSVKDYLLASHISAGPIGAMMLEALGLKPAIQVGVCLREGTGAAVLSPLSNMATVVYSRMSGFEEIHVEQYEHLKW